MTSVIEAGSPANPRAPGEGQTPAFTNRAVEGVMFGQTDSMSAANEFINELQTALDDARP